MALRFRSRRGRRGRGAARILRAGQSAWHRHRSALSALPALVRSHTVTSPSLPVVALPPSQHPVPPARPVPRSPRSLTPAARLSAASLPSDIFGTPRELGETAREGRRWRRKTRGEKRAEARLGAARAAEPGQDLSSTRPRRDPGAARRAALTSAAATTAEPAPALGPAHLPGRRTTRPLPPR